MRSVGLINCFQHTGYLAGNKGVVNEKSYRPYDHIDDWPCTGTVTRGQRFV